MTEAQFALFVSKLPDSGLDAQQAALIFQDTGGDGLSRLQFASLIQEFMVCDDSGSGVVMTKNFDLGDAQLVRKIDPGELFEVLEGPNADPETDMKRARGRALRDGATGWVSILNNKGGALLKPASKPMMTCAIAVPMLKSFDSTSPEIRKIEVGEVFELIAGPQ